MAANSGFVHKANKPQAYLLAINRAVWSGDCSLVRRFCSPKVRKSEIKGSSFRRFCSPKVRKSDYDFYIFLYKGSVVRRFVSPK